MSDHMLPLFFVAVLATLNAGVEPLRPTDASMIAIFQQHESDFDALVEMVESDRKALPPNTLRADLSGFKAAGIKPSRLEHYRHILSRLGAIRFDYFPLSKGIYVELWIVGLSISSSSKSFLYLPSGDPGQLVDDTDHYIPQDDEYPTEIDRRINGNWFIHFDAS